MTSQADERLDKLKAEAKAMGTVTGWQSMKDADKLQAKIDEAKGGVKRSKAPKMTVMGSGGNDRNSVIARLEKEDPECTYLTQSASLTAAEAEAKGFEIVKKDGGGILYCGNDIVVRTDKNSYVEWQNSRTNQALTSMKSIDKDLSTEGGGRKVQSLTEKPKQGRDPE